MALKDTILSDLQVIEVDLGSPVFTWDGQDYSCIPSSDERLMQSDTQRGSFSVVRVLELAVRTDQFPDSVFPVSQQTIQYKGASYRIANVKQDPTGAIIQLICVSTTKA